MANNANKVEFGISNLYFCTYEVAAGGTVTLGTPYHQAGAVSLTLDADTAETVFHADNSKYYSENTDNGFTGSIEVALFDDAFKTQFLGYAALEGGGIAQYKGAQIPKVAVMFQAEGDKNAHRFILYNVTLGPIGREYNTTTDTRDPATESMDINVTGDNATGLVKASYVPDDSAYATLFTTPPVPVAKPTE